MKPAMTNPLWCFARASRRSAFVILLPFVIARASFGADPAITRGRALFNDYIGPLLRERCLECHSHGSGKAKGGLVLDSRAGWATGGAHGPAIVPGKPEESLVLRVVSSGRSEPTHPKLNDEEIAKLREWILLGAPSPEPETSAKIEGSSPKEHWAFQPVRRPVVPAFKSKARKPSSGAVNPIDSFILPKLAEHGLTLAPEARRRTLIRRLNFDLIGLPPTPEEVEAFVADPDLRAFEKLVERLLASPHYGERWGRHWLDVAGFAESSLFIGDQVRPGFWRYRNYVVRAFNADKPYDRFVTEQVAGDELFDWRVATEFTPEQIDTLAATGFLRCPPDATDNQPITQDEKTYATQQAAMEVSIKALLGLTMNCVRCHSHKYDPIAHEDYYRLAAIFQPAYDPSNWLAGIWSVPNPGPIRAIPILDRASREDYERRALGWKSDRRRLGEQVNGGLMRQWRDRELLGRANEIQDDLAREKLAALLHKPDGQRTGEEEKLIASQAERLKMSEETLTKNYPEFSNALAHAKARLDQIKTESTNLPPVIWATFDVSTNPSPTRLLRRGDYEQPAHEVAPGVVQALDVGPDRFHLSAPPYPGTTGRRLALAHWLTRQEHPLTARVMVNRIWQYHFGTGLVGTPDDFGARGARPTHPELLDWLAAEFMEKGWSVKHIHRILLNSATYRQASWNGEQKTRNPDGRSTPSGSISQAASRTPHPADPANLLLWQFPKRRLEAEVVRDAMLEVAGLLDKRLFGESVPVQRLPDGQFVVATNSPDRHRRSIYISTRRTTVPTMLVVLDAPSMDTNWPKRNDSVIPQQALALMNNPVVLECAERFAQRVLKEGGRKFDGRLRRAFALAYARPPEQDEVAMFRGFCKSQRHGSGEQDDPKTWTTICHALLSANEFLYVD